MSRYVPCNLNRLIVWGLYLDIDSEVTIHTSNVVSYWTEDYNTDRSMKFYLIDSVNDFLGYK